MRVIVGVSDGPGAPTIDPIATARRHGVDHATLLLGWMVDARRWIYGLGAWPALASMPAYALKPAVAAGHVAYLPARLASMPALVSSTLRSRLAIVTGIRRGGGFAFTENVGYADAMAAAADAVVVQVVDDGTDVGAPAIEGNIVAVVGGGQRASTRAAREPGPVERPIAEQVAALIPDGATIQYGIGAIPEAVVYAIARPVSVLSGLVTDAVATLADRGLLVGEAVASYAWGHRVRALATTGRLVPVGQHTLHTEHQPAARERFVAINTAVEVGLDGAVNVERAGGQQVAGMGGHADNCAAASLSPGGLSIIAVPSVHRGRSTIVPRPEVVTTPRQDVHVVVTEQGVADLRGLTDDERRRALIAVAHPDHRRALTFAPPTSP